LAAAQNNDNAQTRLGVMHEYGKGTKADSIEASKWYRLAAQQGAIDAQYRLGRLLANQTESEASLDEAVKWLTEAAVLNHRRAQYSLAKTFERRRDFLNAYKWFSISAYLTGSREIKDMRDRTATLLTPEQQSATTKTIALCIGSRYKNC
jgi:TPR repeat protein